MIKICVFSICYVFTKPTSLHGYFTKEVADIHQIVTDIHMNHKLEHSHKDKTADRSHNIYFAICSVYHGHHAYKHIFICQCYAIVTTIVTTMH